MNKNNIIIRLEKKEEYREVENLVRESFWNVYRPGCLEHYVLNQLRTDEAFVPELDFVMEKEGKLIGQNMFMRAKIQAGGIDKANAENNAAGRKGGDGKGADKNHQGQGQGNGPRGKFHTLPPSLGFGNL